MAKCEKKNTLYVRQDQLSEGDVVLMLTDSLASRITAYFTKGPYSHAALVVNHNGELKLFDAQENGIGFASLSTAAHGNIDGQTVQLIPLAEKLKLCVRRHRLLDRKRPTEILAATQSFVRKYEGKQYTRKERLAQTLAKHGFLGWLVYPLFGIFDRRKGPSVTYGPFCSELVVEFFAAINLRAMEKGLLPFETSPNDLSRSRWFVDVPDIVYAECQIKPLSFDRKYHDTIQELDRLSRESTVRHKMEAAALDPIISVEVHIIELTDKDSLTRKNPIAIDHSLFIWENSDERKSAVRARRIYEDLKDKFDAQSDLLIDTWLNKLAQGDDRLEASLHHVDIPLLLLEISLARLFHSVSRHALWILLKSEDAAERVSMLEADRKIGRQQAILLRAKARKLAAGYEQIKQEHNGRDPLAAQDRHKRRHQKRRADARGARVRRARRYPDDRTLLRAQGGRR